MLKRKLQPDSFSIKQVSKYFILLLAVTGIAKGDGLLDPNIINADYLVDIYESSDPNILATPGRFTASFDLDNPNVSDNLDIYDLRKPPPPPDGAYIEAYTIIDDPNYGIVELIREANTKLVWSVNLNAQDPNIYTGLNDTAYWEFLGEPNDLEGYGIGIKRTDPNDFYRETFALTDTAEWPIVDAQDIFAKMKVIIRPIDGADLTLDESVDYEDFARLVSNWLGMGDEGDVNFDGAVDFSDLEILAEKWLLGW